MSDIIFKSIAVAVPREAQLGKLQTDEHGYARMAIGAIGVFNSKGEYYTATREVQDLFRGSSLLQLQIRESALYGENGHPDLHGMTEQKAMSRFMTIHEPNVCTHFRSIYLDTEYYKTSPTMQKGEIAIIAELKPYGDKAEIVQEAFGNPYMNLSYSIRCITQPKMVNGVVHRILKSIITFDKVYMPGIKHASKRNATLHMASESFVMEELDKAALTTDINTLGNLVMQMQNAPTLYSTESVFTAKGVFNEVQSHLERTNSSQSRTDTILDLFKAW